MNGTILWDSISQLDLYATAGSTLNGAVLDDETNAGTGGDGYCNLYLDATSTWIVTGNSTLTTLSSEGSIVDATGNAVSIIGTDGTVYVQGTSEYTVTVNLYQTTCDLTDVGVATNWSDYAVEM